MKTPKSLPVYLDAAASTQLAAEVSQKMQEFLRHDVNFANPGSQHKYGREMAQQVLRAQQSLAKLINADVNEITWTSGATESINCVLKGVAAKTSHNKKHIILTQTAHKAELAVGQYLEEHGFKITYLAPQTNGLLDLAILQQAITMDTCLVSITWINNETGVVQDMEKIAKMVKDHDALLHADAVQALGKIAIDMQQIPIDFMSFSAHKIYGPKGVGALYVRASARDKIEPLIHGAEVELLRSGTLPVPLIVGFGVAADLARKDLQKDGAHVQYLHDKLYKALISCGATINSDVPNKSPYVLNATFKGIDGAALVGLLAPYMLVSQGSACMANSREASHVLQAMGLSLDLARNSLRFSFSKFNTEEEIDFCIPHIKECVEKLRSFRSRLQE